jgi:hypothetical protein
MPGLSTLVYFNTPTDRQKMVQRCIPMNVGAAENGTRTNFIEVLVKYLFQAKMYMFLARLIDRTFPDLFYLSSSLTS